MTAAAAACAAAFAVSVPHLPPGSLMMFIT